MGFYDILAVPFGYALSFLFEITNNYLLSLLLITLIIRLLLLPQAVTQQKNSAKQMRLQAKVNKIRAKYSTLNPREAQMKISIEDLRGSYFLFLLKFISGTGSTPPGKSGLHLKIRSVPRAPPRKKP